MSFFNLVIWLIFFVNFLKGFHKKEMFFFIKELTNKNLFNIIVCLGIIDAIFQKFAFRFFNIIGPDLLQSANEEVFKFFSNKIVKNKILLKEIKEAVIECFFILLFSPRQFSLYSCLVFGTFVLSKAIQQTFLQSLKIEKSTKKNLSNFKLFFFFQILFLFTFLESFFGQVYMSFNRRRVANLIVGVEITNLKFSLKEFILDHIFTLINEKLFKSKWHSQGACDLFLKFWVSACNLISFVALLNNFSVSKKGVFKYYIVRRFFLFAKEIFQNFEEYTRNRKTQICIGTVMENPSKEDIFNLSDNICIVCRDDMIPDQSKKLPCKHVLHTLCLQDWLRRQFGCPICMTPISSGAKKTKDQIKNSESLSFTKSCLNSIAIVSGFTNNIMIQNSFLKCSKNNNSLPTLFPDFTNFFFWKSFENKKNKQKEKIRNFRNLFRESVKAFESETKFESIKKNYIKTVWFEYWVNKDKTILV